MRAEGKPGSEMLGGRPGRHIKADFGEDGLSGKDIDAVDLSEIDTGEEEEVKTKVKVGGVFVTTGASDGREGVLGEVK